MVEGRKKVATRHTVTYMYLPKVSNEGGRLTISTATSCGGSMTAIGREKGGRLVDG